MQIAHLADLHLGKRPASGTNEFTRTRYEDYFKVFNEAVDLITARKTDVLIISGDMFDKKELSPDIVARTEAILNKLKDSSVKVFIIDGNHDIITETREYDSWLHYLQNKGYFTILDYRVEYTEENNEKYVFEPVSYNGINFYGIGYHASDTDKVLEELNNYLETAENKNNIVLAHTGMSTGNLLAGLVKRETIDKMSDNVIYIAGGHLHSYSIYPVDEPYFFVPGSLEYLDFGEYESKKERSFIIFNTDTGEKEIVKVQPRRRIILNFHTNASSWKDYRDIFTEELKGRSEIKEGDIVFINIYSENYFTHDNTWIDKILEEKKAFRGTVEVKTKEIENEDMGISATAIEDTEKEIISQWPGFGTIVKETYDLLQYLKENNSEIAFDQIDLFLDKYMSRGEK